MAMQEFSWTYEPLDKIDPRKLKMKYLINVLFVITFFGVFFGIFLIYNGTWQMPVLFYIIVLVLIAGTSFGMVVSISPTVRSPITYNLSTNGLNIKER